MMLALLLAAGCGSERLAVKTLRDSAAAALLPVRRATVAELVRLPAPRWSSRAARRQIERQVVQLDVEVIAFKTESDGDIHAVVRDVGPEAGDVRSPIGHPTMVVEFPYVGCTVGSAYALQMQRARLQLQRHAGAGGDRIRITGVVFFDKVHGQIGVARNGIELHPVLRVEASR